MEQTPQQPPQITPQPVSATPQTIPQQPISSPVATQTQTSDNSSDNFKALLLGIGFHLANLYAWAHLFTFSMLFLARGNSTSDALQVIAWMMFAAGVPLLLMGTVIWPWFFWHYRNKITIKRIGITAVAYDIIYTAYAIGLGTLLNVLASSQFPVDSLILPAAWLFFFLSFPILWGTNKLIR